MSFKNSDTWQIMAIPASNDRPVMPESRMQGQLACPVWRGLGRNGSQQWEDRAPLPPYITKLLGPAKWTYYYLYVVLDIFSRYAVGWLIADRQTSHLAEVLISEACIKQNISPQQLTIHADRGGPMLAKPLALLLADLGVTQSHSRPYVSNDNPFSEAQFKTLKYRPDYPGRFGSQADARAWAREFFAWYNDAHYHSALSFLTPADVHSGRAATVIATRQQVLQQAYAQHPDRFVKGVPIHPALPTSVWINPPQSDPAPAAAGPKTTGVDTDDLH